MKWIVSSTANEVRQSIAELTAPLSREQLRFAQATAQKLYESSAPLNLGAVRAAAANGPRGATEDLVVIAIIAILIGLLLPAVQKVREAAHRTANTRPLDGVMLRYQNAADLLNTLGAGSPRTAGGAVSPN